MKEADGRTLPALPLSSGLRLGNGRGWGGVDSEHLECPLPTALPSPRTLELAPAFFQLQKLKLDTESLADKWQRWD